MSDLTLITNTADPVDLHAMYQALSARYDEAGAQLDELRARLDDADEDDERDRLAAELDRLGIGHSVLLGWVSAFFAAYTFARSGTECPWLDPSTRSRARFVGGRGAVVRPLTAGRPKGARA